MRNLVILLVLLVSRGTIASDTVQWGRYADMQKRMSVIETPLPVAPIIVPGTMSREELYRRLLESPGPKRPQPTSYSPPPPPPVRATDGK